jgi:hypothetical protein
MREEKIFVSYRREDSAGHAGRLYDYLVGHFGEAHVFQDIDGIQFGEDFLETIERALSECDVLIVIIGRQWATIQDKRGRRRLGNPDDSVRLEVETGLAAGLRVIPVLVQGATMPSAEELPPSLASLTRRHAIEVSDSRFQYDVSRLCTSIEHARGEMAARRQSPPPSMPSDTPSRPPHVAPDVEALRAYVPPDTPHPRLREPSSKNYWSLACIALGVSLFGLIEWALFEYFTKNPGSIEFADGALLFVSSLACLASLEACQAARKARAAFAKDDVVSARGAAENAHLLSLLTLVCMPPTLINFYVEAWFNSLWQDRPGEVLVTHFVAIVLVALLVGAMEARGSGRMKWRGRGAAGTGSGAGYRGRRKKLEA